MDEPSAQLQLDMRAAVINALSSRRPVLHHLNADSSWLLQIPRPESASRRGGRFYYNILIDPWLAGGQSDVAKWFSTQYHAEKSKIGSIAAVEELLRSTETLASGLRLGAGRTSDVAENPENGEVGSFIDVVAIGHEFTDHCHQETLMDVNPDVPVLAADKAADIIRKWSHFRVVHTIPLFTQKSSDWRATSVPPLPEWLGISRLITKGEHVNLHAAMMITFNNGFERSKLVVVDGESSGVESNDTKHGSFGEEDTAEAVIYTPHGIKCPDLALVPSATPPIETLALLHGLHDVSLNLGQQINLGGHNGLQAQRLLDAKYWIGTHDEIKDGHGMIGMFLRRKVISVEDALKDENRRSAGQNGHILDGSGEDDKSDWALSGYKEAHWNDIGNGESRVLL